MRFVIHDLKYRLCKISVLLERPLSLRVVILRIMCSDSTKPPNLENSYLSLYITGESVKLINIKKYGNNEIRNTFKVTANLTV